ncbi:MAG: response regulator [Chloroflexi bacterium]|nr:response regulator [Chloroflexota bacterium]
MEIGYGSDFDEAHCDFFRRARLSTWMLVEDEIDIRNVVKVMFQVWGHKVLEFSNGRDAVAFIDSVDNGTFGGDLPEFLLSDIRMPGPNGNEIAQRMRKSEKLGKIPIILMTAFQLSEGQQEEMRTNDGVNRIIFKPLPDFDRFHKIITEVLEKKYEPPQHSS